MKTIVLNNGTRIKSKIQLKDQYTYQEAIEFLQKYAPYLARTFKRPNWENVHDYYCVIMSYVFERSMDLKRFFKGEHLYLMKAANGLTKIGRSSTPYIRRDQIEIETGLPVRILAVFEKAGDDERSWHLRFKGHNKRFKNALGYTATEWFNLAEADISTIFNNYGTKRQ